MKETNVFSIAGSFDVVGCNDTLTPEMAKEPYRKITCALQDLFKHPRNIESWCEACSWLAKGIKVASCVKDKFLESRRFFRLGLEYLSHNPKELDFERILQTLDDSDEHFSTEQVIAACNSFAPVIDQLDAWADARDVENGRFWRCKTSTSSWSITDEDSVEDFETPPYYAWALVVINRIKRSQKTTVGTHVDHSLELYQDQLFSSASGNNGLRFCPLVVEQLREKLPEIPEENPRVGKFIKWGAKGFKEVPKWGLQVCDGLISKEIQLKALKVRASSRTELFERLNQLAVEDAEKKEKAVISAFAKCFDLTYVNDDPTKYLVKLLKAIHDDIEQLKIDGNGMEWDRFLSAALKLPRYTPLFYDFGTRFPEDAPTEPGDVYQFPDGSEQEVYTDIVDSKWWRDMDMAEGYIGDIIRMGVLASKEIADTESTNLWDDIQAKWDRCCTKESSYHCYGNLVEFSRTFFIGLRQLAGLLKVHAKDIAEESENVADETQHKDQQHNRNDPPNMEHNDSRYEKIETLLSIHAKCTPNLSRFDSVCKIIMDGLGAAIEGQPDFEFYKKRWLPAALQLLCENPFAITHELATLHDISIIKMVFEPILPRLDVMVSLYQTSHPGCSLPDFLQAIYDIVEEHTNDRGEGKRFYYTDDILFDEELWGWRFNSRNIVRLSQCCPANGAVEYFKSIPLSSTSGLPVVVDPYSRNSLFCDYYTANELMFRESEVILKDVVSQLKGNATKEQKCSVLDNTSVIIEALKPLNNTYYLPYTRYSEVAQGWLKDDLEVPAKCERFLGKASEFIDCVCKISNEGLEAKRLKTIFDGVLTSYQLRLRNSKLPLSCVDQRAHYKRIADMLACIQKCAEAARSGESLTNQALNDPIVVTKVEEIIAREHEKTRSTMTSGIKELLSGLIKWRKNKMTGNSVRSKMDDEHWKRCAWIFRALEAWRVELKAALEDRRGEIPTLAPPTEEWLTGYINGHELKFKQDKDGNWVEEERDGLLVSPLTQRQVRTTLQQALGVTINDIKHIYMAWKEDKLEEVHHASIRTERDYEQVREVDLSAGEHNWGGIQDEEADFARQVKLTIGKPKSRWAKKCSKSYSKLKQSLESKEYRFDYRIFMYWIGLRMEKFVNMPKQINFRAVLGTVNDVESILATLSNFEK